MPDLVSEPAARQEEQIQQLYREKPNAPGQIAGAWRACPPRYSGPCPPSSADVRGAACRQNTCGPESSRRATRKHSRSGTAGPVGRWRRHDTPSVLLALVLLTRALLSREAKPRGTCRPAPCRVWHKLYTGLQARSTHTTSPPTHTDLAQHGAVVRDPDVAPHRRLFLAAASRCRVAPKRALPNRDETRMPRPSGGLPLLRL